MSQLLKDCGEHAAGEMDAVLQASGVCRQGVSAKISRIPDKTGGNLWFKSKWLVFQTTYSVGIDRLPSVLMIGINFVALLILQLPLRAPVELKPAPQACRADAADGPMWHQGARTISAPWRGRRERPPTIHLGDLRPEHRSKIQPANDPFRL